MKKDRLDELSDSMNGIKQALNKVSEIVVDCYPTASRLDKLESERKRQQDRANAEAIKLDEQNDCLRRLGIYLAAGAILKWGNLSEDGFYLFGRDGNGIAEGGTVKELIANIPKGE